MATTWTAPMNWSAAKAITAARLNQFIGNDGINPGNLNYLLNGRPLASVVSGNTTDYATTSLSFVDVDAATLILTMTITSGRAFVIAHGAAFNVSAPCRVHFDWIVDGATRAGDATYGSVGLNWPVASNDQKFFTCMATFTGLSLGSHTFKLQWYTTTGTANLFRATAAVVLKGFEL